MRNCLDIHAESRALLAEIDLLQEELAHLFSEEHDLIHTVAPNVIALFQQKLGPWEIKRLEAKIALERARRKLELIRACLNRGEMPDEAKIEQQLEAELLAWQQRLQEALARYQQADQYLKSTLSTEEDRELKKLYYALVKRLHPDLNPNPSSAQKRLWLRVQEAYQRASVAELRALSLLVEAPVPAAGTTLEALQEKRSLLQAQVHALLERLERLESRPPLSERPRLQNEAWIEMRRRTLEQETAECEVSRRAYDAKLKGFTDLFAYGKKPGAN